MKKVVCFLMAILLPFNLAYANNKTQIAIIIDDIGYQYKRDKAIIELDGNISYAILPNAPHSLRLADYANEQGKEIILHLPMQGSRDELDEPETLSNTLEETVFKQRLHKLLNSVPHIIGVNNHMGSVLTKQDLYMGWVMEAIAKTKKDLFYVDSVTSEKSVARYVALSFGIPALSRDVFLDSVVSEEHIQKSFDKLIRIALRNGRAIAIGHPYPETLKVLARNIAQLEQQNIELVPISSMIFRAPKVTQK